MRCPISTYPATLLLRYACSALAPPTLTHSPASSLPQALDVAINSLPSANIHDLPTVIKFINENLTQHNAEDVILDVREKLNLDFSPTPIISSTPLFPIK